MKKVIVPQFAGHDFSSAKEYGQMIELLPDQISPFNLDKLAEKIKERLAEEEVGPLDYLLISGQTIVNCLVYDAFLSLFGKVELLLFHARELRFIHRTWSGGS